MMKKISVWYLLSFSPIYTTTERLSCLATGKVRTKRPSFLFAETKEKFSAPYYDVAMSSSSAEEEEEDDVFIDPKTERKSF